LKKDCHVGLTPRRSPRLYSFIKPARLVRCASMSSTPTAAQFDTDPVKTLQQPPSAPCVSRYRVLRPHARGGLGEVFVAEDTELGRRVALKEIQPRYADQPDSRTRFVLEAEITGGLEHPG